MGHISSTSPKSHVNLEPLLNVSNLGIQVYDPEKGGKKRTLIFVLIRICLNVKLKSFKCIQVISI